MNWVVAIWSATAGASLLLALVYLLVWSRDRRSWANLCMFFSVVGVLGLLVCELSTMYAESPEGFGLAIRWTHLVYAIGVFGSLGFVHFSFRTGMRWLLASAVALRLLVVVANFTTGVNLHFLVIRTLQKITFLGEQVSVLGDWVPNPWVSLGLFASLAQLIYVVDAAIRLWRTGAPESRRLALVVGGALALFTIAAPTQAALVSTGVLHTPFIVSFPFLGVVVAMAYELSRDLGRTAQLGRELRENERQLGLATEAANLGIWSRSLPEKAIWANAQWRELFGFRKTERLDVERVAHRLHPDDRQRIHQAFTEAIRNSGHYEEEYRVVLPSGETRWIASRGNVEFSRGQPVLIRGVALDVTRRRQAEEASLDLMRRLISAQENERMRLARELHDDVNQGLAVLAIELDILGQKPPTGSSELRVRMGELSARVKSLSSSVHELSHALHPAKLEQLGLVAAVGGLCRELGAAHKIAIEFAADEVPRAVPDDIALCLYRIAQEGLHNVIRHSGATTAKVELRWNDSELGLVVSDRGCGFESLATREQGSLGLVSMRERVRLVRGQISVESRKGEGTRIEVRVPVHGLDKGEDPVQHCDKPTADSYSERLTQATIERSHASSPSYSTG